MFKIHRYRYVYFYLSCNGQRLFFYIAWTFGDAVNNASGFGFNGYDEKGNEKWDLLSNIRIFELEVIQKIYTIIKIFNLQLSK